MCVGCCQSAFCHDCFEALYPSILEPPPDSASRKHTRDRKNKQVFFVSHSAPLLSEKVNEHLPTCAGCRARRRSRCHRLLGGLQRQTGRSAKVMTHRLTSSWRTLRHTHTRCRSDENLAYATLFLRIVWRLSSLLLTGACLRRSGLHAPEGAGATRCSHKCLRAAFKSPFLLYAPQRCQERTRNSGTPVPH